MNKSPHFVLLSEGHMSMYAYTHAHTCVRVHTRTPRVAIFRGHNVSKLPLMIEMSCSSTLFPLNRGHPQQETTPYAMESILAVILLLFMLYYPGFVSVVWVFLWEFFSYKIMLGYVYLLIPHRYYLVFPVIIRSISTASGFGLIYSLMLICRYERFNCPGSVRVQMMPRILLFSQAFLGLIFIKMTLTLMTRDCFCPHLQCYNNVLLFASH